MIQPTGRAHGTVLPHETHLVSFVRAAGLEAYRADPEFLALAPLRESAMARTEVPMGIDDEPYLDGSP